MEVDAYLDRIGYQGSREPTADALRQLHRAHMLTVAFENLDIQLGRSIVLSLSSLYDKVVLHQRGGFCYELNGLFGWLLEQLGFSVKKLSARVFAGNHLGPEFDHLVLMIQLKERWIVDVGFGDSFLEPLPLDSEEERVQPGGAYRLTGSGSKKTLERRRESGWQRQYVFSLTPRQLVEFAVMCQRHQTSSASVFTQKTVCSVATADGRITLSNGRLITTVGERLEERKVTAEEDYRALLQGHFGIDLESGIRAHILFERGEPR